VRLHPAAVIRGRDHAPADDRPFNISSPFWVLGERNAVTLEDDRPARDTSSSTGTLGSPENPAAGRARDEDDAPGCYTDTDSCACTAPLAVCSLLLWTIRSPCLEFGPMTVHDLRQDLPAAMRNWSRG